MVTAVLTAATVVLSLGAQASSGIDIQHALRAKPQQLTPNAAGDPTSSGRTARTGVANGGAAAPQGTSQPKISGNGRWQVFTSLDDLQPGNPAAPDDTRTIYVRDLQNGTTVQLSRGVNFETGNDEPALGDSTRPDITDDGRFVTFITTAGNIASTGSNNSSVVVCDRDPDGDNVFDEVDSAGNLTNVCAAVYTGPFTGNGSIALFDTPHIAGFGGRVVWTEQQVSTVNGVSISRTHVWTRSFSVANGSFSFDTAIQVPNRVSDPCPNESNLGPEESEPVIADNSGEIYFAADYPSGCTAILGTFSYAVNVNNAQTERLDVVPTGCGTGFLGDFTTVLTGPCTGGSGGGSHFVDAPTINEFGSDVLFRYHDGPSQINFLSDQNPVDWLVLTSFNFLSGNTSQVVSRDNAGNYIDSTDGAISEDGRYLVFETLDCGASDGADLLPCQNPQRPPNEMLVARDLVLDAQRESQGLSRLPGALVTFHDPGLPTPPGCTPASGQLCVSGAGTVNSISMDDTGALISYNSTAFDLIVGDNNASADSFVHTWTPTLSSTTTDFGDVQVGTHAIVQVPVTITGFGPVRLGATSIGGSDPGQFSPGPSTCENVLLFTGDSCTVAVNAAPTSVGTKNAIVRVASEQYPNPVQVAAVSVNGVLTGAVAAKADNTRTSVRSNGNQSPTGGDESMISGNGRYQVFESDANLAGHTPIDPSNSGRTNIFVRDLADPQNTVQISLHSNVAANSGLPSRPVQVKGHPTGASPDDSSFSPSISSDGRFVSFITQATDIVPMDPIAGDEQADYVLVVCDRDPTGTVDSAGNPVLDLVRPGTRVPNYVCFAIQSGRFGSNDGPGLNLRSTPRLSGDGTHITWVEDIEFGDQRARVATLSSPGGKLHAPAPTNPPAYITSDVPGFTDGATRTSSDAWQTQPTLSEDGTKAVFVATNCLRQCAAAAVIETDLTSGTSTRLDLAPGTQTFLGNDPNATFDPPAMSDDGNTVAFAFRGTNDPFKRVFVATIAGGSVSTVLESRNNQGQPSAGADPALSGDGRYLAFQTSRPSESNAVDPPGGQCFDDREVDHGVYCQIVARDLVKDLPFFNNDAPWTPSEIVSSSLSTNCPNPLPAGRACGANDNSSNPSIDATGSEIGFDSPATDIVVKDDNQSCGEGCVRATDAFVHTWRPSLTVVPSFDFGTRAVGAHRDRTYTVTSERPGGPTNFGPVSLGAATITGTDPDDFKVLTDGCNGKTLNDGNTCTFKLRFAPTAAGPRKANLAYPIAKNSYPRHNPDNSISYDPALLEGLTGVGSAGGVIAINPATLDFGSRLPLAPGLTKTVTLTNTGGGPITVTDVSAQDTTHPGASGDYTVDATDCLGALPPGGSCALTVTFIGHKIGNRGAQLVVTDDTSPNPTIVTLLAKVPKPKVLVNPAVIAPGRVTLISGTGFAPHRLVDVTLDGFSEHVQVRADGKGAFDVAMVIFRSTPEGPQTIVGHTHSADKSVGADTPLLIATGTIDDLGLVTRH